MDRSKLEAAGFDVEEGMARLLNDEGLYVEMMGIFLEDENYAGLKTALDAGDVETAYRCAHTLKGVASNLSITSLYDAVLPLVELLRTGSMDGADAMYAELSAVYEKVCSVIREL